MENFVAIGSDELGTAVKKGDKLVKGNLSGILEYGKDVNGKENNLLGFVTCGEHYYLVAINDQLVFGWEKCDEQARF